MNKTTSIIDSLKIGNRIYVADFGPGQFLGFAVSSNSARVLLDGKDLPCYVDPARITKRGGGGANKKPKSKKDIEKEKDRKEEEARAKLKAIIRESTKDFLEIHGRKPTEEELQAWIPSNMRHLV